MYKIILFKIYKNMPYSYDTITLIFFNVSYAILFVSKNFKNFQQKELYLIANK